MKREQAEQLIEKYLNGTASAAEQQAVDASLNRYMEHSEPLRSAKALDRAARHNRKAVLAAIRDTDAHRSPIRRLTIRTLPYAAAVLVAALVGYFAMVGRQPPIDRPGIADIAPGGNRATLTLADGRAISLSEAQTGIVVGEGISYTDGSLVLKFNTTDRSSPTTHHTLTTPKGGTYQITLPDGSRVWLNANSTLKYPSQFPDNERIVELVGEAYFDVAKAEAPFRVVSKGQRVEVLGTQFNISAYADEEETKTTLVEGRVGVALNADHRPPITLSPGEQSTVRGAVVDVQQVDVSQYTAWKDGLFIFNNEPLENILKQVARWYDVEVNYQDESLRGLILWGKVSRNTPISSVLNALALTEKVQFKLTTGPEKERRLTVMK